MCSDTSLETLADGVLDGDSLSLARLISRIESREPGYRDVMDGIYRRAGDAWTIGVTGPPGVGKSTLVDDLVAEFRERDQTVGIIAVDPSSPFTGGSVLGDRVRMASTISDDGVFCRSMSARGEVGGLSNATSDVVYLMDAFGFDVVIIETVGAGQSEIDIVRTADTVAVTVHPSAGDEVQTIKAGILEIGDVFVVNKADLDGAEKTRQQLTKMVMRRESESDWVPPVVATVATEGTGTVELVDEIHEHREFLAAQGITRRDEMRVRNEIEMQIDSLVREQVTARLENVDSLVDRVLAEDASPYSIATDMTTTR